MPVNRCPIAIGADATVNRKYFVFVAGVAGKSASEEGAATCSDW